MGGYSLDYKKRLDRINQLALKAREFELTKEEVRERDVLRREYVADFRSSFKTQLDTKNVVYVEDELGV